MQAEAEEHLAHLRVHLQVQADAELSVVQAQVQVQRVQAQGARMEQEERVAAQEPQLQHVHVPRQPHHAMQVQLSGKLRDCARPHVHDLAAPAAAALAAFAA